MAAMQTTQTRWFCEACRRQWIDRPSDAIGGTFDGRACPGCGSAQITLHQFVPGFPGADLEMGSTPTLVMEPPAELEQPNYTILMGGLVGE
jgi:hypothetical protein